MSEIHKLLSVAKTLQEKARALQIHYFSRRLHGEGDSVYSTLEPSWIHSGYELAMRLSDGEKLSDDERHLVEEIVSSHELPDGFTVSAFPGMPNSPQRIIHDGWKAGTPTWIFMGRTLSEYPAKDMGNGWIATSRTIPDKFYKLMDQNVPPTLWIAYHMNRPMGLTAMTSNVIGPATSFEELEEAVNQVKK